MRPVPVALLLSGLLVASRHDRILTALCHLISEYPLSLHKVVSSGGDFSMRINML